MLYKSGFFTINHEIDSHILVHIPHSSLYIPEDMSDDYVLKSSELEKEKRIMADMFSDELFDFAFKSFGGIRLDVSRVFLDVERFRDDSLEPMAQRGMGLAYTKTSMLEELRSLKYKKEILQIYDDYHRAIDDLVEKKLQKHNRCLIIDCHSFPSTPKPFQIVKDYEDVDICIGFDDFHKESCTVELFDSAFKKAGYRVWHNYPYQGSLVSNRHFMKNKNVKSVMIELNKRIYMDDVVSFQKSDGYERVKGVIESCFS